MRPFRGEKGKGAANLAVIVRGIYVCPYNVVAKGAIDGGSQTGATGLRKCSRIP